MSDLIKRAERCAIGLEAQARGMGPHSNYAETSSAKAKTVRLLIAALEKAEKALQIIAWEGAESVSSKQILAACRDTAREAMAELSAPAASPPPRPALPRDDVS